MSVTDDVKRVTKNISGIYDRREAAVFALSLRYAGLALADFRQVQAQNVYWENRTKTAKDKMFSDAFKEPNAIGWFLSHGISYGVYLELANDGQNEAIKPTVRKLVKPFIDDIKKIYGIAA